MKQIFLPEQEAAFFAAANPHQWFLTADNLHEQAVTLYDQRRQHGVHNMRVEGQTSVSWDSVNRATFLLAAFALENALKSFLVYEFPDWLSGGRLAQEMKTHNLVTLGRKSTLIPYRKRDEWILAAFEAGNTSWMRYPCGVAADEISPEEQMSKRLWLGYRRVMRGYGARITKLFHKG